MKGLKKDDMFYFSIYSNNTLFNIFILNSITSRLILTYCLI